MDFCPKCGAIIYNGTKCSNCGASNYGFYFEKLKIITPNRYIKNKGNFRNNYEKLLIFIKNKDEVEFSKNDILRNYIRIIDKANNNFIQYEKKIILNDFGEELNSSNEYITDERKSEFKSKYNKDYYKYYDNLNFESRIEKFNKNIIYKEKQKISQEFKEFIESRQEYIFKEDISDLKSRFKKDYFDFYAGLDMEESINEFNQKFINSRKQEILDNLPDKYISHSQMYEYQRINSIPFELDSIVKEHNNNFIEEHLKEDIDFFDDVDGKSLDLNQKIAVLTDDDNNQIVAGAGTGKTLTIQAKVKYLIEKQGILPEDILCISFSNSARDDLERKLKRTIGDAPVEVRTFHSLGYSILGINGYDKEVPKQELSDLIKSYFKESLINDSNLIKELFEFLCYYYNVIHINSDNLKLETIKSRFHNLNEYDEYLREYLQMDNVKKFKEYMYSVPDLVVANYLFTHNIRYEYSKQALFKNINHDNHIANYYNYVYGSVSEFIPENIKLDSINSFHKEFDCDELDFYPSFFLPEEDLYIDLVSYGYDWNETLDDKEKQKIIDKLEKRDKLNQNHKSKLLTVFNYNDDIDGLLESIHDGLMNYDVKINDINYNELFEILITQEKLPEYGNFIQTIESFINLFKGNGQNIDYEGNDISEKMFKSFFDKNHEMFSNSTERRNEFFLEIIKIIYDLYCKDLEVNEYIDFNDMINDAIIKLRNGAYIHDYKYVIVDEYQDTSHTRYKLLKEVQNVTEAKVVVVGDDWQSIYGFTGCDVNLFSQFDNYFENPKMVKINITRRNSQRLIDIVGDFIQENKNQIEKELKSDKVSNKFPIKIFEYESRAEEVLALMNILNDISKEKQDAEVLILGRNNKDIYEILCKEIFETVQFKDYTKINYHHSPDLKIEFRTVHKSKGLEADYVVVLNLNNRIDGFPNKIVNDPILDFVNNKQNEDIEYPEERRLFYVALTRTKNNVYLFNRSTKPSQFVNEIRDKIGVEILRYVFSNDEIMYINQLLKRKFEVIETDISCPKCGIGNVNLIVNNEKGTSYFRCSNFCGWKGAQYHNKEKDDGTRKISYMKYVDACPRKNCEGLLIVRRNSNDGSIFLGCTSYPDCRHTENIRLNDEELNNIIFNIEEKEINRTPLGIYHLDDYIPVDRYDEYEKERVDFSKRLLGFKDDKDDYSVILFTREIMNIISHISNNEVKDNITKLALIAIPSSKVGKRNNSIKKSIDVIEEWFDKGELTDFDVNHEIINFKNLFKRVKDVPTAHLGEGRATCEEHIESIECMQDNLSDENTAYIILDDITTTGSSMQAGNEILLENGVKESNIYNIAIGATVRDDDGEI